jgi:hypothetical protein
VTEFWLSRNGGESWEVVPRLVWLAAERQAGFIGGGGVEPATSAFENGAVKGRVCPPCARPVKTP